MMKVNPDAFAVFLHRGIPHSIYHAALGEGKINQT
jgi:hypothetical protein